MCLGRITYICTDALILAACLLPLSTVQSCQILYGPLRGRYRTPCCCVPLVLMAFLVCLRLSYDHGLSYRTYVDYGDELCEKQRQQQQSIDRYFAIFISPPSIFHYEYILFCTMCVCDRYIVYTVCCPGVTYVHCPLLSVRPGRKRVRPFEAFLDE